MLGNDAFPTLHSCSRIWCSDRIYDIKFYPYATEGDDQIFAVTAETDTFICRPKLGADPPFEVLVWVKDELYNASFNSLIWAKHPETNKPLLCIAGHVPKHIKLIDVESGKVVRTLTGHGKGINDLAVSPLCSSLLASAAEDNTIRLWNLDATYADQPCVAMFGGAGHTSPILAIRFHPNGKWLLSGGIDTVVCLWAVPSLAELDRTGDGTQYPIPKIIYYPHFFSREVHPNYVDCFEFFSDMILSRSAKDQVDSDKSNEILLWKIDGFDPDEPPPLEPPMPKPGIRTRSSFRHDPNTHGFLRVLTFSMPSTDRFFHRFALLHRPGLRPMLVMGNQMSKYYFWDLQRLEEGQDPKDVPATKKARGKKGKSALSTENTSHLNQGPRSNSVASGTTGTTGAEASDPSETSVPANRVYTLDDRIKSLPPHSSVIANTKLSAERHFGTTQMAWSPDGTWLVGGGDFGMMCFFHRDKSVV